MLSILYTDFEVPGHVFVCRNFPRRSLVDARARQDAAVRSVSGGVLQQNQVFQIVDSLTQYGLDGTFQHGTRMQGWRDYAQHFYLLCHAFMVDC